MMIIVPYLRKVADLFHLTDVPNEARKTHKSEVPLVGGIAIALSLILSLGINVAIPNLLSTFTITILFGATTLLILGIIDDKILLSPFIKLAIQFCCAYFLISQGLYLDETFESLFLGWIPILLKKIITLLFIVGVINAYNLIDGIDGLAGNLFIIAFGWIAISALLLGNIEITFISFILMGALKGFLKFNLSRNSKIFMGDSGSLFIAFILAGLSIQLLEVSRTSSYLIPISVGLVSVLAIPILDQARVYIVRIMSGRSPFYADRSHIHHILLQIKNEHRIVSGWIVKATLLILLIAICVAYFGGTLWALGSVVINISVLFMILDLQNKMNSDHKTLMLLEKKVK